MVIRRDITISICVASLFALLLTGVLVKMKISPLVESLEQRELLKDIARAEALVHREVQRLNVIAKDWGYWDDTYRYLEDANQAYRSTNLIPMWLQEYDIDALILYSRLSDNWQMVTRPDLSFSESSLQTLISQPDRPSGAFWAELDGHLYLLGYSAYEVPVETSRSLALCCC